MKRLFSSQRSLEKMVGWFAHNACVRARAHFLGQLGCKGEKAEFFIKGNFILVASFCAGTLVESNVWAPWTFSILGLFWRKINWVFLQ